MMPETTPPSKADIERVRVAIQGPDPNKPGGLTGAVNRLAARDRNNRIVIGLAIAMILATVASLWWVNHTLHNNAVVACEGGNTRLEDQRQLWEGLVIQSDVKTEKERRALKRLQEYTDAVYAPRDCDRLDVPYKGPDEFPDLGLG